MSDGLPKEDPFRHFDYKLKWRTITRQEFEGMYKKWTAFPAHPDKAGHVQGGSGTVTYQGKSLQEWNNIRDQCTACFDYWESRREGPEFEERMKKPRERSAPGTGKSWNLSLYAAKPSSKSRITDVGAQQTEWEQHKFSKAPASTSIDIFSHRSSKLESARIFSLIRPGLHANPQPETRMKVVQARPGYALLVRQKVPEEARNKGWFAMCPEVPSSFRKPAESRVEFSFVENHYEHRSKERVDCSLDCGRKPEGFVRTETPPEPSRIAEEDNFVLEARSRETSIKIKRIHLYGSQKTVYEENKHCFDPAKVQERRVIAYTAQPGSIMAVSTATGKFGLFCARSEHWTITLVFDKKVFRIAEVKASNKYVAAYWKNPCDKSFDKLYRNVPRPSEWIKFI